MMDRFATLKKACGGSLSIEALTEFQKALREYEVFMSGMRELLAPLDEEPADCRFLKGQVDFPFQF